MRMSASRTVRLLTNLYEDRVAVFLDFIDLKVDCVVSFCEGDDETMEKNCSLVFPYGWLNPLGEFIPVGFAQHEATVRGITGYDECDEACADGWIKFTVGLPYNQYGQCLFEPDADKKLISSAQLKWLNAWLEKIAEEETRPRFLKVA